MYSVVVMRSHGNTPAQKRGRWIFILKLICVLIKPVGGHNFLISRTNYNFMTNCLKHLFIWCFLFNNVFWFGDRRNTSNGAVKEIYENTDCILRPTNVRNSITRILLYCMKVFFDWHYTFPKALKIPCWRPCMFKFLWTHMTNTFEMLLFKLN